jgi:hypothetical protein
LSSGAPLPCPERGINLKETTMNIDIAVRKAKITGLKVLITVFTKAKDMLPRLKAEKVRIETESSETKKIDDNWDDVGCI